MKPTGKLPNLRSTLINVLRSPWTRRTWVDTVFVAIGLPLAIVTSTTVITLLCLVVILLPTTVLAVPFLVALYWCSGLFTTWQLAGSGCFTAL